MQSLTKVEQSATRPRAPPRRLAPPAQAEASPDQAPEGRKAADTVLVHLADCTEGVGLGLNRPNFITELTPGLADPNPNPNPNPNPHPNPNPNPDQAERDHRAHARGRGGAQRPAAAGRPRGGRGRRGSRGGLERSPSRSRAPHAERGAAPRGLTHPRGAPAGRRRRALADQRASQPA